MGNSVLPTTAVSSNGNVCYTIMASESAQSSLQLGVGLFMSCLFTYVLPISFPPMSCVVATWLCVVAVMASPANHLGVRMTSACSVLGSTWVGAVLAAVVGTLSQASGPMFSPQATAVMGVLGPAVLAVLATVRVAVDPPMLWAQGMNSCLAFGLTALTAYTQAGHGRVWYLAGTLVLANTIAAVVVVLVAALVLPTHATEEVQTSIADVLLHSGVATSRYAGRLFRPAPAAPNHTASGASIPPAAKGALQQHLNTTLQQAPASSSSDSLKIGSAFVAASSSDWASAASTAEPAGTSATSTADTEAAAEAALAAADSLIQQLAAIDVEEGSSVGGYDARVDIGTRLEGGEQPVFEPLPFLVMKEAHTEEEWLQLMRRTSTVKLTPPDASSHPLPQPPIAALRPRLAKAQSLFMSAAALEPQWLRGGWGSLVGLQGCYWFDTGAWGKAAGCLQLLLTRLSALEAVIEDGQSLHVNLNPSINPNLLNHISLVFSKAASSLANMSHTVRLYGNGNSTSSTTAAAGLSYPPRQEQHQQGKGTQEGSPDANSSMKGGIASAVDAVCGRPADQHHCWQQFKMQLAGLMQTECEQHWADVMTAASDSPMIVPTLTGIRHIMFTWSLTNAIIDTLSDLEQSVTKAVCSSPEAAGCSGLLQRMFSWLPPCLPLLSGRNQVVHWYKTVCCDLPKHLRQGWPGVRSMLSSPNAQAGFKYWLVLCIVLEVTLGLLYSLPVLRPLNPGFGIVAAALTMSQKVEATVSKFVFWFFGTIFGGALGFLAMWHPALATNPYGLVAVSVAAALVVGSLGVTKARIGITLTLMTMSTVILCQCCGHVGNWAYVLTRVCSVLFGVTLSVLVCNMLLPWYTSAWSIQTMKTTFVSAVELINQMHAQFYADGAAFVAAFESQWPSRPLPVSAGVPAAADAAAAPAGFSAGGCTSSGAAAAANAAADVAEAAGAASALVSSKGGAACPRSVSPAVLQTMMAKPLVAVQTSLLMDTVAWQRGVLATPPVVPAFLRAMFSLLDRMAGLQLALTPPSITHKYTGHAVVNYGVPMAGKLCELLQLCAQLAAAVAAVLEEPSCEHSKDVQDLLAALQSHRVTMYARMQQLRQQLHMDVHRNHRRLQQLLQEQQALQQQGQAVNMDAQICPVKRQMEVVLGGVDDTVRYLGFQFASIKTFNMIQAVASVAIHDVCRVRNTATCTFK